MDESGTAINNYSLVFRELYCVAAADLAKDLNQPLERIGILYDDIINTGQEPPNSRMQIGRKDTATGTTDSAADVGQGSFMGKGQLLFLVSSVGRRESERYRGAGNRFAHPSLVLPFLSKRLQIRIELLSRRFEMMREYVSDLHMLDPGIHMACFAIRAALQVGRQGFDILARKDSKNALPTMQLPIDSFEDWQVEWLKKMDSMSVSACIKYLFKNTKPKNATPVEQKFAKVLLTTLEALKEEIDDPFFNDTFLVAKPIEAPCRGKDKDSPPGTALLLAFRIVTPIHSRAPGKKLEFVSMNFFKMQQHVYQNSPSHIHFARKSYREFYTILGLSPQGDGNSSRSFSVNKYASSTSGICRAAHSSAKGSQREVSDPGEASDMFGNPLPKLASKLPIYAPNKIKFWDKRSRSYRVKSDNSSEKGLVDHSSRDQDQTTDVEIEMKPKGTTTGGLLNPQTPNDLARKAHGGSGQEQLIEMRAVAKGYSGTNEMQPGQEEDSETFVDVLFKLTIQKRGF